MTLKLVDNQVGYTLAFNVTNVTGTWTLTLTSQLSNLDTLDDLALNVVVTNNRYTEFSFDIPSTLPEQHKNGIYDYTITNGIVTETGLLKLVTGSGGGNGTVAYESNNENRQGPVYYQGEY